MSIVRYLNQAAVTVMMISHSIHGMQKDKESFYTTTKFNHTQSLKASLISDGRLILPTFYYPVARNVQTFEWSPKNNHLCVISNDGQAFIYHFSERADDILSDRFTPLEKNEICLSSTWDHTGTIIALLNKKKEDTYILFYNVVKGARIASRVVAPHTSSCSFNPRNHVLILKESVYTAQILSKHTQLTRLDVSDLLLSDDSAKKGVRPHAKL